MIGSIRHKALRNYWASGQARGLNTGDREGRYAVRLTASMRVTFGWDDEGAANVDIEDYH